MPFSDLFISEGIAYSVVVLYPLQQRRDNLRAIWYSAEKYLECLCNGCLTGLIKRKKGDDFSMKVCTRDYGMVGFIRAAGEDDLIPYCTYFDFTMAEAMGVGLKHISSIETWECVYCFTER
jgi:hypothetical protein